MVWKGSKRRAWCEQHPFETLTEATCATISLLHNLFWFKHVQTPFQRFPGFQCFFPTSLWGFCFLPCTSRRPRPRPRPPPPPPPRAPHLTHHISHTTHLTQLITHNSSHTTHLIHNSSLTQLISHTTHLTHNSSHPTHLTQLISHNSSHTQLISHNSFLTQLISHTTHLTHNSSHTQLISHNSSHTQLISHNSSHTPRLTDVLLGRRSTQSFLKELRRGLSPQWPRLVFVWQAQYTELPEGAAARIVAAVAAARFCVAGAVHAS